MMINKRWNFAWVLLMSFCFFGGLSFVASAAPENLVSFDTNGMAGNEGSMSSTAQNANLNPVILTRGPGLGIPSSPPINTFSADSYVVGGVKANAVADGEYFQVVITPKSPYKLSLSSIDLNLRRSGTGPQNYQWLYSLDGFTTPGIDIGFAETYTGTETKGTARPTIDLSGISALQNILAGTSVTFRLYAWGATNATGTYAVGRLAGDDLKFMGNVDLVTYNLNYTAGANGSLIGNTSQTVNHGSNGTAVTAVPNVGYHFVNWSDASTDNPRTDLNVSGNINVTANFAINSYSLVYEAGVGGSLTGNTSQTVNHGSNGTAVTAVANSGYLFQEWSDGVKTATRTDLNITANLTVTAKFRKLSNPIIYTAVGIGSGLIDHAIPMYETKVVGRLDQGGINILSYLNGQANFEAKESRSRLLKWHHIKILNVDMDAKKVTIEVSSEPQTFVMTLKETIYVDLDGDQIKDVSIKYEDLQINRVELTVKSLLPDALESAPIIDEPAESSSNQTVKVCPGNFTRELKQNMSGIDVKELQQYLNQQGFYVADVGAGSVGHETEYFGVLTKSALARYQQAKGITATFGEFDLATRVYLGCANAPITESPTVGGKYQYNRNLDLGMTGADVKELQKFLNNHGFVIATEGPGSPGNETEVFGILTKQALARYQADQEIVPANGVFSDWTRWWLNKQ